MTEKQDTGRPASTSSRSRAHAGRASDAELIQAARGGDKNAFGVLWQRHWTAGRAFSAAITTQDADDVVSESFARIFKAMQSGSGPRGAGFRSYLYAVIRNTSAEWGRQSKEVAVEPGTLDLIEDDTFGENAVIAALDRTLTAKAFSTLNPRYQEVLWYSEVEQLPPAELAPILGIKPGTVAVLAFRAKERLRQAWIQAHVSSAEPGTEHHWVVSHAGAYARNKIEPELASRVEDHTGECTACALVIGEATDVGGRLRAVLPLMLLGGGAASAYFLNGPAPSAQAATLEHAHQVTSSSRAAPVKHAALLIGLVAGLGAVLLASWNWRGDPRPTTYEVAAPTAAASATPAPTPPVTAQPVPTPNPAPTPSHPVPPPSAAQSDSPPPPVVIVVPIVPGPPVTVTVIDQGRTGLLLPLLQGTAAPGARVVLSDQGGVMAFTTADASGAWSAPPLTGLAAGEYTLTAATPTGSTTASLVVATPPALGYTAAAGGLTLTLNGVPGATVTLRGDGKAGTWSDQTIGSSGTTQVWLPWTPGTHTLTALYGTGDRTGAAVNATVTIPAS